MNTTTQFYEPVQKFHVWGDESIQKHNAWIQERGLGGDCDGNLSKGKHGWLFLPQEKGQKQYIICIHCLERGHT